MTEYDLDVSFNQIQEKLPGAADFTAVEKFDKIEILSDLEDSSKDANDV